MLTPLSFLLDIEPPELQLVVDTWLGTVLPRLWSAGYEARWPVPLLARILLSVLPLPPWAGTWCISEPVSIFRRVSCLGNGRATR